MYIALLLGLAIVLIVAMPAASSRVTMNGLLRTVYTDMLREQFSSKAVLLQEFPRDENTKNQAQGDRISVPLHTAGGGGFAYTKTSQLPKATAQKVSRAYFDYTMMTDRIEIDKDLSQDTSDGAHAETEILDFEVKGVARTARRGLSFHLYGDGTGKLAGVASASDSTTIVLDSVRGIQDNQKVDIVLTASGAVSSGVQSAHVTVNRGTKTVTLQDSKTLNDWSDLNTNAANYTVYRQGSRFKANFGLDAWISTSNPPTGVPLLGDIDRTLSANEFYKANVFANGGTAREITFPLIQDMLDQIDEYADGESKLLVVHPRVWQWIAWKLNDQKQFVHDRTTLRGWMSAILFGDMRAPIVKDPLCPPGSMYFLDPSLWRLFQINEGQWMDDDGGILHRVADYVAYEASWFRRLQLVCLKPIAQGRIDDIETTLPGS